MGRIRVWRPEHDRTGPRPPHAGGAQGRTQFSCGEVGGVRDPDIRAALLASLASVPGMVLPEWYVVRGNARIDVAHLTETAWTGYEIKSPADSTRRLHRQVRYYGQVFDRLIAVVAERHLDEVQATVPNWLGIVVAVPGPGGIALETVREPQDNPAVEPVALAEYLWRVELEALVLELGLPRGLRHRSKWHMAEAIAQALPLPDIRRLVTERIAARGDWRRPVVVQGRIRRIKELMRR